MKIAVFDNEYYPDIGFGMEYFNEKYHDNKAVIDVFKFSQEKNLTELKGYDAILIDLDLSPKSTLDGFGIVGELLGIDKNLIKKIIIITALKETFEQERIKRQLPELDAIFKPINWAELSAKLNKLGKP